MPAARVHDLAQEAVSATVAPLDPSAPSSVGSAYQRLLHSLHNDPRWLTEVNLGKRVGFYRFRGDLGSGNFSQVKMAIHQLTKGRDNLYQVNMAIHQLTKGRDNLSQVMLAIHQLTKEQVAIKILDKSKLEQKTRKMLAREIATMEAIHHPNIIRLYEVVETYSKIYLVMEYARGGELFNKLTTYGRFQECDAKPLFAQVISAVEYMHEHNFIHRDIKAENVFYSAPSLVKLGDFGFSTQLTTGREQQLNTFCGSPPYAAPELFRDESYLGAPVDVWALGVLLFFMVTAQMPFKAQTVASLKKHILDGSFIVPAHVSAQCRALIGNTTLLILAESVARSKLSDLGISEVMLEEHEGRGVRSSIIGAYRIMVHRVQRQGDAEAEVADGSMGSPSRQSAAASSSNHFCLSSLGRRSKSAMVKSKGGKNSRSRTCALL
nr:unnamed protein product [Timema tahoe]